MHDFIDIYCERLGPGLAAEPVNAVTNLAFFIAAFLAFRLAQKRGALNAHMGLLLVLLVCIGTGSTLFHTLAVHWAMLSDTIPILLFQIAFLSIYARQIINLSWLYTGGLLLTFFACVYGFGSLPQDWLNGSLDYAPALIFLSGLGIYHCWSGQNRPWCLLLAAAVFVLSLTFRSIDMAICHAFPLGVHFLWHILNALVLFLCLRALIENYKS